MTLLIHGTGAMGALIAQMAADEGFNVLSADEFTAEKGEVIISFSHFSRMPAVLDYSLRNSIPIVIATTGWGKEVSEQILSLSKRVPVLVAANTSLGVNVLHAVLKQIVPVLAPGYDIEITEKHHNKKADAPSGTAKALAKTIMDSSPKPLALKHGREGGETKRAANELGVHSLRGGTVAGEHSIFFFGEDEIIEISHSALSKKVFAKGALTAAKFLKDKTPALYTMDDIFNKG